MPNILPHWTYDKAVDAQNGSDVAIFVNHKQRDPREKSLVTKSLAGSWRKLETAKVFMVLEFPLLLLGLFPTTSSSIFQLWFLPDI